MMMRIIMLLSALLLMFDLADDGGLGKVRFVSPHASVKVAAAAPHPDGVGPPDSLGALPPAEGRGPPGPGRSQPVLPGGPQTLKLLASCHLASSGGIPL